MRGSEGQECAVQYRIVQCSARVFRIVLEFSMHIEGVCNVVHEYTVFYQCSAVSVQEPECCC